MLPAERVNAAGERFEERYGFLRKPGYVRFRCSAPVAGFTELSVRADELTGPPPGTRRAFIIENEITYLAFPLPAESIVIYGSGYAAGQLGPLAWLADLDLTYWGDIDTHGLAILSRLRHRFPHARSILMDEATLLAHRSQWGTEPDPTSTPPYSPHGSRAIPLPVPPKRQVRRAPPARAGVHQLRLRRRRTVISNGNFERGACTSPERICGSTAASGRATNRSRISEEPDSTRISGRFARPLNQPPGLQGLQARQRGRPAQPDKFRDIPGAQGTVRGPHRVEHGLAHRRQAGKDARVKARDVSENQAHASAGLLVHRIREPYALHLFEDALDSLAKLLADTQIGAHARYPGIPGEPADLQGPGRISQARKTTGLSISTLFG